jgi:hypothetical protein
VNGPERDPPEAGRDRRSTALRTAVVDVLDPGRLTLPITNIRRVKDHLLQRHRGGAERRMTDAYQAGSTLEAQAAQLALVKKLDRTFQVAAGQPRGPARNAHGAASRCAHPCPHTTVDELHRVDDLGLPSNARQALARRLYDAALARSRDGRASQQFHRVTGHLHLPSRRAALQPDPTCGA